MSQKICKSFTSKEILFAHLWLFQALNLYDNPYIEQFANFINQFGAQKVYLAHLYDVRRAIDQMWSDMHFNAVKDKIKNADMFTTGGWIEF